MNRRPYQVVSGRFLVFVSVPRSKKSQGGIILNSSACSCSRETRTNRRHSVQHGLEGVKNGKSRQKPVSVPQPMLVKHNVLWRQFR